MKTIFFQTILICFCTILLSHGPIPKWEFAVDEADIVVQAEIISIDNIFEDIYRAKISVSDVTKGRIAKSSIVNIYYRNDPRKKIRFPKLDVGKEYLLCLQLKELLNERVWYLGFERDHRLIESNGD